MTRQSTQGDPEQFRRQLVDLLVGFESELTNDDFRAKVRSLVPAFHLLRKLGSNLADGAPASARDRILAYFRQYPFAIIGGDELLVVSGIGEWARRVRELRVEHGWKIASGVTIADMDAEELFEIGIERNAMRPDHYILLNEEPDVDLARRWKTANDIRNRDEGVRDKILAYLRANVGVAVTNEELRYIASDSTEWARRVRELRTEFGWPLVTRVTGRPDLAVGEYLLEMDRKSPDHSRRIDDATRVEVLRRDEFACQQCGWTQRDWNKADPRILELHHKKEHAKGGGNEADNLVTLCNKCHDKAHKTG